MGTDKQNYKPSIIEQEFMGGVDNNCLLNDPEGRASMKRDLLRKLGVISFKVNNRVISLKYATPEQLCDQIKAEYLGIQQDMGII